MSMAINPAGNFMKSRINLLITSTVFATLHQAVSQVAFAPATNYPAVSIPSSVAAADINGDGKVDLIYANEGNAKLMVLTNNGNGIFGSNAIYSLIKGERSVLAADVNGDGKVDVVCLGGGNFTVLTNNGTGSLVNAGSHAVGDNNYSWFVTTDVNGDGRMDLVCPGIGNPLVVLTNAGNGTFAAAPPPPPAPGASWFTVATDANGDGKTDLIDVDTGYMRVLTNAGNGTFALCSTNTLATSWPGIGTTVDVNGDGRAAVVVPDNSSGSGTTLTVWTNRGDGIFGSNATYTVPHGPYCVIATDIQGDGRSDLICGYLGGNTLSVLTNNGSGGFGSNSICTVALNPMSIVAADVDGNGKMDLITANINGNNLSVLINTSTFLPPVSIPSLALKRSGKGLLLSWPSASPGWSLQQNPDLATTDWSPSGYSGHGISDDGTNKNLIVTPPVGNLFFRLMHP
jgi:hypothetical protein